jgi:c-di-GMP-binding flagellar brake protein YcgR
MSVEQNRRKHPRLKTRVPVEFNPQGRRALASATADLSIGGCYLRIMFTFPIGTVLDVNLQIGRQVRTKAVVVTQDIKIGNGLKFIEMSPEDKEALRNYLDSDGHAAT